MRQNSYWKAFSNQKDIREIVFSVLDIETTGPNIYKDHILEVAVLRFKYGEKIDSFHSTIKPLTYNLDFSSQIHGITKREVEESPLFQDVSSVIYEKLKDSIIIGHNAYSFDIPFLNHNLFKLGFPPLWNPLIELQSISYFFYKKKKNLSLKKLSEMFNVKAETFHRALQDAKTTLKIFLKALDWFLLNGFTTYEDFYNANIIDGVFPEKIKEFIKTTRNFNYLSITYHEKGIGMKQINGLPVSLRGKILDFYSFDELNVLKIWFSNIINYKPYG